MTVYTKLTREEVEQLVLEYFGPDVELVSYEPISDGVTNSNYIVTTRPKDVYNDKA
jgi:hypothetical protein